MNFAMDNAIEKPGRHQDGRWLSGSSANPATQFRPGISGNPSGISKSQELLKALEEGIDWRDLAGGARKISKRVGKGDLIAWTFVCDRLIGKVRQAVELSGPGGGPIQLDQRCNLILERMETLDDRRNP